MVREDTKCNARDFDHGMGSLVRPGFYLALTQRHRQSKIFDTEDRWSISLSFYVTDKSSDKYQSIKFTQTPGIPPKEGVLIGIQST